MVSLGNPTFYQFFGQFTSAMSFPRQEPIKVLETTSFGTVAITARTLSKVGFNNDLLCMDRILGI